MLLSRYKSGAIFSSCLTLALALSACAGNNSTETSIAGENDSISIALAAMEVGIEDDLNGGDQTLERIETDGCRSVLIAKDSRWHVDWSDTGTRLTNVFNFGFFMLEAKDVKIALLGNSTKENLAKLPALYDAMESKIEECRS